MTRNTTERMEMLPIFIGAHIFASTITDLPCLSRSAAVLVAFDHFPVRFQAFGSVSKADLGWSALAWRAIFVSMSRLTRIDLG